MEMASGTLAEDPAMAARHCLAALDRHAAIRYPATKRSSPCVRIVPAGDERLDKRVGPRAPLRRTVCRAASSRASSRNGSLGASKSRIEEVGRATGCQLRWMTVPATPAEIFHELVHGVCDERWEDVVQLYAEQIHVCHPFAADGTAPLLTREQLREHFIPPAGWTSPIRRRPANIRVHHTADPEVIVAEFEYQGENIATGQAFAIPCIFVLRIRDGQIIESRDYIDHARSMRARGQ